MPNSSIHLKDWNSLVHWAGQQSILMVPQLMLATASIKVDGLPLDCVQYWSIHKTIYFFLFSKHSLNILGFTFTTIQLIFVDDICEKNHIWTCTWKHRFCLTDMCIVMDKIHEIHWWILPVTYKWIKWTGVWIWMLTMPLGKMNMSKQAGVAEFVCIHWTVVMIDYTFARPSKSKLNSKPPNSICHSLLFRLDQVVFMAN